MRDAGYICYYCRTTFEKLPRYDQGHWMGGTLVYERNLIDCNCPKCGESDGVEQAYICTDCGLPVPESATLKDWDLNIFCDKCRTKCKGCDEIIRIENAYYNEHDDSYYCKECRNKIIRNERNKK